MPEFALSSPHGCAQDKCSSRAERLEKEIVERQAELATVQRDRAARKAQQDALAKDIADTERRLQVPFLSCHSAHACCRRSSKVSCPHFIISVII